jgi:LacI family transcriptional regulator
MATIKEIAKESGVSIATVSNIINGKPGAGEETRKRVLETIKRLDYRPNAVAKNLKQKSSKIIGVITEDLTIFNTPAIVDGINEYCEEHSYEFVLGNLRLYKKYEDKFYDSNKHFERVLDEFKMMESKQVQGIIYVGCHSRNLKCIPSKFSLPIVIAYGFATNKEFPSVVFNDEQGAYEATCKLIEAGHKNIGVICGPQDSVHTQQRLLGYQRALYENKILFNPRILQQGDWSRRSGYEAGKAFMKQNINAIFAMNDIMAGGIYDYCYEKEYKVGKDIAIVGFDNQEISNGYTPGLSTVELPLCEIGKQSAKLLINMISKPDKEVVEPEIYKINCKFIERKSVYKI